MEKYLTLVSRFAPTVFFVAYRTDACINIAPGTCSGLFFSFLDRDKQYSRIVCFNCFNIETNPTVLLQFQLNPDHARAEIVFYQGVGVDL